MSEENIEVVRNGYDAFNAFMRGERAEEALAAVTHPDFEYDWPAEQDLPKPDHDRGVPEAFAAMNLVKSAWVDFAWEPREFIEASGNRVFITVRGSGRDRESGLPIESQFFQVITLRDGRVRKLDFFRRRNEALEAAGLSE